MGGGLVRRAKSAHDLYILLAFVAHTTVAMARPFGMLVCPATALQCKVLSVLGEIGCIAWELQMKVSDSGSAVLFLSLCATPFAARTTLEKGTHVYMYRTA